MKKVAFYLRVSKEDQNTDNQKLELERIAKKSNWHVAHYFTDIGISGAKSERPEFIKLKKAILHNEIDMVAAWSVCRLGRSLQDLMNLLTLLREKKVDLYLHQQGLDTSTSAGKAMFQMIGVFSEFEHAIISERVKAGLQRAKINGIKLGRPMIYENKVQDVLSLRAGNVSMMKIAKKLKIGTGTVQKILKQYKVTEDIEKIAELDLWLCVENNNKFLRGKSKVIAEIEDFLKWHYNMRKLGKDSWEYEITVKYTTEEDLDEQVESIIGDMCSTANRRYCTIEYSLTWEEGDKSW
jgi:DNA invertase Pin-like site-specific DNA recombinase